MPRTPSDPPGLRLAELVAALSLATDLGTGVPTEHALRSSILAVRLGEVLGTSESERRQCYYLALLRWICCTSTAHLDAYVFGDEIAAGTWTAGADLANPTEFHGAFARLIAARYAAGQREAELAALFQRLPELSESPAAHWEVAQRLATRLGLPAELQGPLGQMTERWDGRGGPRGLQGEQVLLPVRIVALTNDVEHLARAGGLDGAVRVVRSRAGGAYDPAVADGFCRAAPRLLGALDVASAWEAALAAEPGPRVTLADDELDAATRTVADFVDLKSPYLVGHSSGVAELAAAAARRCGLDEAGVVAVRRSGMLHDLGRIGVSTRIWDKPGPLTDGEWERVRLHAYYAERVLARPAALARLGALAALHHERLDGSGYHRGSPGALLSVAARILAAADTYHALTEPRPYRPPFTRDAAAATLRQEVRAGRLDGDVVQAVLAAAGHASGAGRSLRPAGLSEREVEVLRLIALGHTNAEIGEQALESPNGRAAHPLPEDH